MGYINTNIGIEVNLFEAALKQKCFPKFLIISSGSLYDPKDKLPLIETSRVDPGSPYAVSKLGQEQMAQYYGQRGFEYVIARPFNHVGPGQNEGFIVPDLTKQIVSVEKGNGKNIKVGNLEAQRDYTDVRDIVRAYRLLVESGKSGEIYNICSNKPLSGNDLLSKLIDLSSSKPELISDPTKFRPTDSPVIYGSYDKLKKDTGWEPEIDIDTTLKDVLEDWRTRI
jgi:GDP-4-dehydro-6-deoxy-D-mannose reductase